MTKDRKIDLLYRRAHGQRLNLSPQEMQELNRYRVSLNESDFYATRKNIKAYVEAVDRGAYQSFSDWCQDNLMADKRRRGSSKQAMAAENTYQKFSVAWIGWIFWGLAVYWFFGGALSAGVSALLGIGVALGTFKLFGRRAAGFTQFLLPVILMVLFFNMHS